ASTLRGTSTARRRLARQSAGHDPSDHRWEHGHPGKHLRRRRQDGKGDRALVAAVPAPPVAQGGEPLLRAPIVVLVLVFLVILVGLAIGLEVVGVLGGPPRRHRGLVLVLVQARVDRDAGRRTDEPVFQEPGHPVDPGAAVLVAPRHELAVGPPEGLLPGSAARELVLLLRIELRLLLLRVLETAVAGIEVVRRFRIPAARTEDLVPVPVQALARRPAVESGLAPRAPEQVVREVRAQGPEAAVHDRGATHDLVGLGVQHAVEDVRAAGNGAAERACGGARPAPAVVLGDAESDAGEEAHVQGIAHGVRGVEDVVPHANARGSELLDDAPSGGDDAPFRDRQGCRGGRPLGLDEERDLDLADVARRRASKDPAVAGEVLVVVAHHMDDHGIDSALIDCRQLQCQSEKPDESAVRLRQIGQHGSHGTAAVHDEAGLGRPSEHVVHPEADVQRAAVDARLREVEVDLLRRQHLPDGVQGRGGGLRRGSARTEAVERCSEAVHGRRARARALVERGNHRVGARRGAARGPRRGDGGGALPLDDSDGRREH
ncbi:hypothetical protein DFJ74DRAFT_737836, partial [Hyaloraphidium curvatum]